MKQQIKVAILSSSTWYWVHVSICRACQLSTGVKMKGTADPVHATNAYTVNTGIAPLIPNL
jgi:hypothetical protein